MPDPAVEPLTARSAAFNEPADGTTKSEAISQNRSEGKKEEPAKPWMPLILVSLGLFASLGGNAYLTWIFADLRRRYRALFLNNVCKEIQHGVTEETEIKQNRSRK